MKAALVLAVAVAVAGAGVGCASYSPDLGPTPFACGSSDPVCPDGYACVSGFCMDGTDTGSDSGSGSGMGSGSGSGNCHFTGMLASWDLSSQPGSQTSTPSATSAPGLTAAPITRAPALTASSGTGSINASNWSLGGVDPTKYYTVTLTPPAGCSVAVSMMALDVLASGTGPADASVGTSADTFAHATQITPGAPSTPAITATATGALEIRIYGFAATAMTGTMRVQNTLSITGTLQ